MKIAIVAGEASGDLLAAALIRALKTRDPAIECIVGIGGDAVRRAGYQPLFDISCLSMMGLEPLWHLPRLIKLRSHLYRYFCKAAPLVFIGIDSPDFNLGLAYRLRRLGIRTVHYVSPSVWAWRQYRVRKIKRSVDLMLTCFPFEADFYKQHQLPHVYVGHPLADCIPLHVDTLAARKRLALNCPENITIVALLPGSRTQEMAIMARIFLEAAKKIWQQKPNVCFVTASVDAAHYYTYYALYQRMMPEVPIHFFIGRSHDVIAASDLVLVKSGTGTLETMLFKKPMIIAYRTTKWVYWIARSLVRVSYIGLPNLLANKSLVPELIQEACTASNLAALSLEYLNSPEKVTVLQHIFMELHQLLAQNASERAADAVFRLLHP